MSSEELPESTSNNEKASLNTSNSILVHAKVINEKNETKNQGKQWTFRETLVSEIWMELAPDKGARTLQDVKPDWISHFF